MASVPSNSTRAMGLLLSYFLYRSIGCLTADPSKIGTNPAQDGKLVNAQADQ